MLKSGGGLLLGVALAWVASELMRRVEAYQIEILLTLSLALGGYALAETLSLSAPLEAVAAGLALRRFNMNHLHVEISHESLDRFWRVIDEIQNAILFVLLGFEVLVIPFTRHSFESGGLAIISVIVVRILVVTLVLGLVRLLQPGHKSSLLTLSWGRLTRRLVDRTRSFHTGPPEPHLDSRHDVSGGRFFCRAAGRHS